MSGVLERQFVGGPQFHRPARRLTNEKDMHASQVWQSTTTKKGAQREDKLGIVYANMFDPRSNTEDLCEMRPGSLTKTCSRCS
mmetsp:Transcript_43719/g.94193  ORF Transcript_43719/g.94193 Transcript_43719/m.94193 type:complete len:83 (-) Transcript_43719:278-526(-)